MKNAKAVILAGSTDFDSCPLAARLPKSLWPIAGKSVLQKLIDDISNQGITRIAVCSNNYGNLLCDSINVPSHLEVEFLDTKLFRGTAGSIRDAVGEENCDMIFVFYIGIIGRIDLKKIAKKHQHAGDDMAIIFNPVGHHTTAGDSNPQMYICNSSVLKYIPDKGYFDIEENLIPEMVKDAKTISAMKLSKSFNRFEDWQDYLYVIGNFLTNSNSLYLPPTEYRKTAQGVLIATNAKIDPTARVFGPAVIMDGVTIAKDAVILGPVIIDRNANVGQDSLVAGSTIWQGACIGRGCQVHHCLLDEDTFVKSGVIIQDALLPKPNSNLRGLLYKAWRFANIQAEQVRSKLGRGVDEIGKHLPAGLQVYESGKVLSWFLTIACIFAAFLWLYWQELTELWSIWLQSDEYSSGLLVPLLAVYIAWSRRKMIRGPIRYCLWGLLLLLSAQGIRFFGLFFMYSSAQRFSLVLSIAGLILFLFGWQIFRKVLPIVLFLFLMLPLPRSVHSAISLPLQDWATTSAVFCLETFGYMVIREGNVIHLDNIAVAVAEACNGLRMVTAFFVINGLVVLLVQRAWWEKLIVLISSLPIGLFCNTIRLTATSTAFTVINADKWEQAFHDFGGFAMMPLALAMVVLELWILSKLIVVRVEK